MGGPVVGVALRKPLHDPQIDDLDDWLRDVGAVSNTVRDPNGGWFSGIATWDLAITDGSAIGMEPISAAELVHICTVIVKVGATRDASGRVYETDEDSVAQWVAQVGFFPDQEIWLSAMCNSPINHRILGHMALGLAERYDGILNLSGAWYPPIDLEWLSERDPVNGWAKVGATPFVYQGPGEIYEIHYTTVRGTHWYSNLADIEAFRFGLQREYFRLIK